MQTSPDTPGRPTNTAGSPRTPGKRLFIAGTIVLALFSAVHMIPMFNDIFGEPTKPDEIEAKRAMAAVVIDMGPFHTNWAKLHQLLSASYSALLFFVVALNLVGLPAVCAPPPHGRLRALALVNVIFVAVLLIIALIYQFPPPGVFALIALILFLGAWIRAR